MSLSAEHAAIIQGMTPLELHHAVVKLGTENILTLFDALPWFRGAADWTAWRAFLAALYALPMSPAEFAIYKRCTGRQRPPEAPAREAYMAVGRRGRKTAIAALIGVYVACYTDHETYLAPGARALIPMMAKNKEDAKQLRDYIVAILTQSFPYLLDGEPTIESIRLKNRCDFQIKAATETSGRGPSVPLFLGDEIAHWRGEDYANPDTEILKAVRPAQAQVPNPLLVGLSSVHGRSGALWEAYSKHYGHDEDQILVWKATSLEMHQSPGVEIERARAMEEDEEHAKAEYDSVFRPGVNALVTEELVTARSQPAIRAGAELAYAWVRATEHSDRGYVGPQDGMQYMAFVDPSGGQNDSFTLAVAHWERKVILDLLKEWESPFDFDYVLRELGAILTSYGLTQVHGDKYGEEITAAHFRRIGVMYYQADRSASDLYRDLLPIMNSEGCELLDVPRLKAQLVAMRRKPGAGKDVVFHPGKRQGKGHDDCANAVAGAVVLADNRRMGPKARPAAMQTPQEAFRAKIQRSLRPKPRKSVWGMSRKVV